MSLDFSHWAVKVKGGPHVIKGIVGIFCSESDSEVFTERS